MDMSTGEKSAWVSLCALAGAFGWYVKSHAGALIDGSLGFTDMLGGMVALVILMVVVEVTVRIILGIESAKKEGGGSGVETDERDALIDARSDRLPYIVIFTGAIAGIWSSAYQAPIVTAHVILAALMAAETVKLVTQLIYYRRGV